MLVNQEFSLKIAGILGDAAQSKAEATEIVILGGDNASPRIQAVPVGSGASRTGPPVAKRRTYVEVAVGTVVDASTQELERPCINTIVAQGAGVACGVWGVEYRLDAKISSLRAAILKYLCLLHFGSKTSERANFGLTGPKSVGVRREVGGDHSDYGRI